MKIFFIFLLYSRISRIFKLAFDLFFVTATFFLRWHLHCQQLAKTFTASTTLTTTVTTTSTTITASTTLTTTVTTTSTYT